MVKCKFFSRAILATALLGIWSGAAQATCAVEPFIGSICYTAADFCPEQYLEANGQQLAINQYAALYSLLGVRFGGNATTNFNVPDLRARTVVGRNSVALPGRSAIPLAGTRGAEQVTLNANQLPPHVHPATVSTTAFNASGNVSLPTAVTWTEQAVSVKGSVKLANSVGGGATTPVNNAVLTKAAGAQGAIYAATGTADLNIGPEQTFTGTLPAKSLTGTAMGSISLPVTGSPTVTIGPNATNNQPVNTVDPQIALTACIAVYGIYPTRP